MSKITITVSGPVGVGKSAVCAKLEILLKHLGCAVEWVGGQEEKNLSNLEDWSEWEKTPIEIVERVVGVRKVYETFGKNGWVEVSQEEYDRTKYNYSHRIRRVPVDEVTDKGDALCIESDGCPTERAVLQRFWRAHSGRAPQIIDQSKLDELLLKHSEWTPHGTAIVDTHRQKFAEELLELVSAKPGTYAEFGTASERFLSGQTVQMSESTEELAALVIENKVAGEQKILAKPLGFMMKHESGHDRGFSWNKDDHQFSSQWERVGMYSEDQVQEELQRAKDEYQEREHKWREAFEAMHQRAMRAEAKILTEEQRGSIDFAIGYMGSIPSCKEEVAVLKTIPE